MSEKYKLSTIMWATGTFFGGLALGALFTPKNGKKNREILSRRSSDAGRWIDHQRKKAQTKSQNELRSIRRNVAVGFRKNIPDLYEATAQIDMSGHKLR